MRKEGLSAGALAAQLLRKIEESKAYFAAEKGTLAVIGWWSRVVTLFHQRMAELWLQSKKRQLSLSEAVELEQCQQLNVNYVSEAAYLANMSLLASMSKDTNWQHEICKEIEQFQLTGKRRKSGSAGAE